MIGVKCNKCNYKLIKPRWEHIVNTLYREGGHAGKNTCPKCHKNTLEIDFQEGES